MKRDAIKKIKQRFLDDMYMSKHVISSGTLRVLVRNEHSFYAFVFYGECGMITITTYKKKLDVISSLLNTLNTTCINTGDLLKIKRCLCDRSERWIKRFGL